MPAACGANGARRAGPVDDTRLSTGLSGPGQHACSRAGVRAAAHRHRATSAPAGARRGSSTASRRPWQRATLPLMDLAYLRAHPEHLPTFLTHQRIRETPVSGGDICAASRLTLDDGHSVFAKTWPETAARPVPEGFFAAEAAGLRWLREAGDGGRTGGGGGAAGPAGAGVGRARASRRRRPPSGSGGNWPRCTGPARRRSGREWPGFIGALPAGQHPAARARGRAGSPQRRLAAVPAAVGRRRRAHRRREPRWSSRWSTRIGDVRRGRAAGPDPRRPVAGQPALGRRRPGLAGRPGGARRAPGDRPGPARALRRRTAPGPDPRRLRGGVAARRRLAGAGAAAPAPPAAGAHRAVRRGVPRCGRPGPPGQP